MIDRSMTREIPHSPVALHEVVHLFGALVAETILASVHVRAHKQAGHMDASDLIKALQNTLQGGGRPHMGNVDSQKMMISFFSDRLLPVLAFKNEALQRNLWVEDTRP